MKLSAVLILAVFIVTVHGFKKKHNKTRSRNNSSTTKPVSINEFPYAVCLVMRKPYENNYEVYYCDGTIIDKYWILIPGFCYGYSFSEIYINHGHLIVTGNASTCDDSTKFHMHHRIVQKFVSPQKLVVLFKVKQPFEGVNEKKIPNIAPSSYKYTIDSKVMTIGWERDGILKKTEFEIADYKLCEKIVGRYLQEDYPNVSFICIKEYNKKPSCKTTSLLQNEIQIGITISRNLKLCRYEAGIYVPLNIFSEWIANTIKSVAN